MANFQNLKNSISEVIKTNGNNEITGKVLQDALLTMISNLGANYQFAGIANPTTNPGTPDGNVFYIASKNGSYPNFGVDVPLGYIGILYYNGVKWHVGLTMCNETNTYNLSTTNPSDGIDGTLYYDLSTAVKLLSDKSLSRGTTIKFVTKTGFEEYILLSTPSSDENNWVRKNVNDNPYIYKGYVDKSGEFVASSAYKCTDFIPFNKYYTTIESYVVTDEKASSCAFFDENYNYISSIEHDNGNFKIEINSSNAPENAKYIRLTCQYSIADLYGYIIINDTNGKVYPKNENLIGDLFTIKDAYIAKTDGLQKSSSSYKCTDFIPIDKSDGIDVVGYEGPSSVSICSFYNENKNYISSYQGKASGTYRAHINAEEIPDNALYIRCSAGINDENAYVFNRYMTISNLITEIAELKGKEDEIDADTLIKASAWLSEEKARENYLRSKYEESGESGKWYGVEWKEEDDPENVIAINSEGDDNLHELLPIQNKMRRCVSKNGIVQYYLNPDNSELKEDGTKANLDGTDGDVMVEIPEYFYRCEEEVTDGVKTVRIKISEQGLPGFKFMRRRYTSAYIATLDRTSNKLVSVCTTLFDRSQGDIYTENASNFIASESSGYLRVNNGNIATRTGFTDNAKNYRGGTNDSTYDDITDTSDTNYSKNQLGVPLSNINRNQCREYADTKHGIFMYQYDTQRSIWILAQIEYKTRKIRKPISSGGLGYGATTYPDYNAYEAFFKPQRGISVLPCGVTNSLGNNSGEVYYRLKNVPVESSGSGESISYNRFADVWVPCMSYRGVEHFYGDNYKIVDQINLLCEKTDKYVDGHEGDSYWRLQKSTYYYEHNPYLTSNSEKDDSRKLGSYEFPSGIMCASGLLLGEEANVLHTDAKNKDYTQNYCCCAEQTYTYNKELNYITFNGRIVSAQLVGWHFICGVNKVDGDDARPSDSTRIDHF